MASYDNNRPVKLANNRWKRPHWNALHWFIRANPSHKLTVGDVAVLLGGTEITSSGGGGTTYDSTTD